LDKTQFWDDIFLRSRKVKQRYCAVKNVSKIIFGIHDYISGPDSGIFLPFENSIMRIIIVSQLSKKPELNAEKERYFIPGLKEEFHDH